MVHNLALVASRLHLDTVVCKEGLPSIVIDSSRRRRYFHVIGTAVGDESHQHGAGGAANALNGLPYFIAVGLEDVDRGP